jgi:hypothetical protein
MLGYVAMRSHRLAGIGRAMSLKVRLEIGAKALHCGDDRIYRVDSESAE